MAGSGVRVSTASPSKLEGNVVSEYSYESDVAILLKLLSSQPMGSCLGEGRRILLCEPDRCLRLELCLIAAK